jgi:hypothetical protein
MATMASADCLGASAVESFFACVTAGSIHHLVVTLGPVVEGSDDIFGKLTMDLVATYTRHEVPKYTVRFEVLEANTS